MTTNELINLDCLVININREHCEAICAARQSLIHAVRAGDLLLQAKAQVNHGEWLEWVKANCKFSDRTARAYMRLAENQNLLPANWQTTADLTIDGALELLTEPKPIRELEAGDIPESGITKADFIRLLFQENGRIPSHDPYPEEFEAERYPQPIEIKTLPIDLIKTDEDSDVTDLRSYYDPAWIDWLASIFDTLPPIAVFWDGKNYWLSDGVYRMKAANQLGIIEISCRVYKGDGRDALLYAIAANSRNGMEFRSGDWRRFISQPGVEANLRRRINAQKQKSRELPALEPMAMLYGEHEAAAYKHFADAHNDGRIRMTPCSLEILPKLEDDPHFDWVYWCAMFADLLILGADKNNAPDNIKWWTGDLANYGQKKLGTEGLRKAINVSAWLAKEYRDGHFSKDELINQENETIA